MSDWRTCWSTGLGPFFSLLEFWLLGKFIIGNQIIFINSLAGESKLDTNLSKENLVQNYHQQVVEIHHHQSWHRWSKAAYPIKVCFHEFSKKIQFRAWNNVSIGQSFLQQTNRQNTELNLPQEAFPQSFDQKQPQNEKSQGFGTSGGGFGISLKSG